MKSDRDVRGALEWGARGLARRGIEGPRLDAELLLAHTLGTGRAGLYVRLAESLDRGQRLGFARLLRRRRAREPVAYILGRREFFGLEFAVGPGVLVPRPETEELVEAALDRLARVPGRPRVLDIGTGSGNIAVAIAAADERVSVLAVDASERALVWARLNVRRHGLEGRVEPRACALCALCDALAGARFDLVVSNPPYVEPKAGGCEGELAHEPAVALVGEVGEFPAVYRDIAAAAATLLKPGGALLVEVGAGQAERVREVLAASGRFAESTVRSDLAGIPRVVGVIRTEPGQEGEGRPAGGAGNKP